MNLLVTNDDGISSVFLHTLVAALREANHNIFVVAPAKEQSWTGASKTRNRPVKSAVADYGFGCPTWTVDGTPSDCINIAMGHLISDRIDGVVSGINVGFNCTLGFIIASGTVAGAWEGALHGLPAMAVSQDVSEATYNHLKEHGGEPDGELLATLQISATHAARMAGDLLANTPPRSFIIHNVNFPYPCRADATTQRTVPAQFFAPGLFSAPDPDGAHRLIWTQGEDVSPAEPLSDLACLSAGHISHSVLDFRRLGQV